MTAAERLLADLGEIAEASRRRFGLSAVTIGVVVDGAFASSGFGVADPATGAPVTDRTIFRLCSVTKPFTATLAMALAEDGLLELEEPIVKYLPELNLADAGVRETLTMRHLLSHTTGFECELPTELDAYGEDDAALDRAIADFGLLRQWLPAGTAFGYCNAGYWLAGAVIARVAGESFEAAMRRRVLDPLGLRSTFAGRADASADPLAQPPARPEASAGDAGPPFPRCRIPSGGLLAPIGDVLRFGAFHLGAPLSERDGARPPLSRSGRGRMLEMLVPRGRPDRWQGLGWALEVVDGNVVAGHTGSYGDYYSLLLIAPAQGSAVAALVTGEHGDRLVEEVRAAFLTRAVSPRPTPPPSVVLDAAVLASLAGRYAHPGDRAGTVTILPADAGLDLTAAVPGEEPFKARYLPISPTEFVPVDGSDRPEDWVSFVVDGAVLAIRFDDRLGGRLGTSA